MPSVLKENTAKPEGATSPWDGLILIAPTWTTGPVPEVLNR